MIKAFNLKVKVNFLRFDWLFILYHLIDLLNFMSLESYYFFMLEVFLDHDLLRFLNF